MSERPFVAVIMELDDPTVVYDHAWTWETGQNYAMQGYVVRALADDAHLTKEDAQRMYDACLAQYKDCFGL